jgi:putative FmdB family regulatory protein
MLVIEISIIRVIRYRSGNSLGLSFGKGVPEMPIYEYHCSQCKHEFEKLVFNSSEKIVCPKCKSKKVGRMMSAFAFSSGGKFKSTASSSCGSCAATSCSTCNK